VKSRVLLAVLALSVGLLPAVQAQAATQTFSDVPSDSYYATAVAWLVDQGITTGTTETTFSPDEPVTRGQMAAFLWRYAGRPAPGVAMPFTDVPVDAYYYNAVSWLVGAGITTGTSATTFSPDEPVTRGQMAAFLWRYAGEPEPSGAMPFTDVPTDAYYYNAVSWLVGAGITAGTSATTFSPDEPMTRGQTAAFLWRDAGEPEVVVEEPVSGGGPAVLRVVTSTLGAASIGEAYTETLAAAGGTGPYAWAVTVGGLPSGLTLHADTGVIDGTPDTVESQTFTVEVTDHSSDTSQKELTIQVLADTLCATQTDVPEGECDALVGFYDSTDGPNWTDRTGWDTTLDVCSWYGVTCTTGHVTELVLQANELAGPMPSTIAGLTELVTLDLGSDNAIDATNALTGNIPSAIGSLSNLDYLDLRFNQFDGPIPDLSGTSLTRLLLRGNQLTGTIPTWLGSLTGLTYLYLAENQLTGDIPTELGSLTNLQQLFLGHNQLTGTIPASFGGLTNLTSFFAYHNDMSGVLPDAMMGMTSLTTLRLEGQTGCLTAESSALAAWLSSFALNDWNSGCVVTLDTASPLPGATQGTAYTETLTASGGTGSYTWAVTVGGLPSGLTLHADTGVIDGTPDTVESQTFTVEATDSDGTVGSKEFTLDVAAP
jgi:hypothetical protein